MASRYSIGPSIGIARVGNSPDSFYIGPDSISGLPTECSSDGILHIVGGLPVPVRKFKDPQGRIRRQAAMFRIYRFEDGKPAVEVTLADPSVQEISWSAHLASKKACWYNFAELQGNLLYGEANSYKNQHVEFRNPAKTDPEDRKKLIIDPGPRTLNGALLRADFSASTVPPDYHHASFPPKVTFGEQIKTLGSILTDDAGRLLVLGGFGKSGGDNAITSFAGADTWHDDISDGPVTCAVTLKSGEIIKLTAWCVVGSPKFVPEVTNIVTLADTMFDVAVRDLNYDPKIFASGAYQSDYVANFERDIEPILDRPAAYRWVANLPSMNSVSPPPFDARDNTAGTAGLRKAYLALFRKPGPADQISSANNQLFSSNGSGATGFPLMPLNSGSNSVSNEMIDKFLTLTETQYFFLSQWAAGKFTTAAPRDQDPVLKLSEASVGNCVGGPFCPGIEVTWSTRNPNIYSDVYALRHRHDEQWYTQHGLDPFEDETADKSGCEPGDLTKRMAIPWQADFFQCSIQFINFTNPKTNKGSGIPQPPTYYAYWWPPQSPWQVITGDLDTANQDAAGTPAGYQVLFSRGINTFAQMVSSWYYMGFVVNQATTGYAALMPYIVEQERNHRGFIAAAVAVGDATNVVTGQNANFSNTWFLPATPRPEPKLMRAELVAAGVSDIEAEEATVTPAAAGIQVGSSRQRGRQ
jgi:L-lysine 6-oxidase